jgi:hypothetical protein
LLIFSITSPSYGEETHAPRSSIISHSVLPCYDHIKRIEHFGRHSELCGVLLFLSCQMRYQTWFLKQQLQAELNIPRRADRGRDYAGAGAADGLARQVELRVV